MNISLFSILQACICESRGSIYTMLDKSMSLSPLSSDFEIRLLRAGKFYIYSHFNKGLAGPPILRIGESIYYRFMNFIYLPQTLQKFGPKQTIEICDIRLKYLDELVDLELNRHIIAAIVDRALSSFITIPSSIKALDFGCGSGLSSELLLEYIPNLELIGVDISENAILYCHKQGLAAVLTFPEKPLPFEAATFDLIFAIFVMHFNISMLTLLELRRVLRDSGKFLCNVYQLDVDRVSKQLRDAGFYSIELKNISGINPNHILISCSLLPP